MRLNLLVMLVASLPVVGHAEFKYESGRCRRGTELGMNPGVAGPCGDLRFADKPNSNWAKQDLTGADLSGSNLFGSDLGEAKAMFTGFNRADLRIANFTGGVLEGADFRGARLDGARLTRVRAPHLDLRGVKASGVDFTGADLTGARAAFGYFNACDFTDADLRGVDFTDAVVVASTFARAKYDSTTRLPFGRDRALKMNMTEVTDAKK